MKQYHKKIKEALKKHNYEVVITSDGSDKNAIKANFPQRKQEPAFAGFWAMYEYRPDINPSALFFRIGNGDYSAIECPRYSMKEVLLLDIEKVCAAIGYSNNLVSFHFDEKEIHRQAFKEYVFSNDLTEEEETKQGHIEYLCETAKRGEFTDGYEETAKSLGVMEAYNILKDMYFSDL
jgi:hypothetical protein